MQPNVAVLIPCLNEAQSIGEVVQEFKKEVPGARIYVFDNGSTDGTVREALRAGAVVKHVSLRGNGPVVQAMFRQVEADVYLMVDRICNYPAGSAQNLIRPVIEGKADMVVGARKQDCNGRRGSRLFRMAVNFLFRSNLTDLRSGYRAFSRAFVRSTKIRTVGLEIGTELTLRALAERRRIIEVPLNAGARASRRSVSKRVSCTQTLSWYLQTGLLK